MCYIVAYGFINDELRDFNMHFRINSQSLIVISKDHSSRSFSDEIDRPYIIFRIMSGYASKR
jgi:hypothetical protein